MLKLAPLGLLVWAMCFAACSPPPARPLASSSRPALTTEPGKHALFSAFDLSLLETPDRNQWQRTDDILDDLKIADGSVVADIAAGGGWFAVQLARRVGPAGIVYAEEIQSSMIETISLRIRKENLTNIKPVLGTPTDPHLPPADSAPFEADRKRTLAHERNRQTHRNAPRSLGSESAPRGSGLESAAVGTVGPSTIWLHRFQAVNCAKSAHGLRCCTLQRPRGSHGEGCYEAGGCHCRRAAPIPGVVNREKLTRALMLSVCR